MSFRRLLLLPFSMLYAPILHLRNFLFDTGVLKSAKFNIPIIGVGNLAFGGTGKSPFIEYLIRQFPDRSIATLSRGYKRSTKGHYQANENSTAQELGDEPFQFHKKFDDLEVHVNANRKNGINRIQSNDSDVNLILLDDSYQHRWVNPGLNILLTRYDDLYIHDVVAPAGNLREPKSGMHRADIIIVTKSPESLTSIERKGIKFKLSPSPYQTVYFAHTKYANELVSIDQKEPVLTESLKEYDVLLLTGIADAADLKNHLDDTCKSVKELKFSDHHQYTSTDIRRINKIFDNIVSKRKLVLTTEKDAMRLLDPALSDLISNFPTYYLPIEFDFINQEKKELNDQLKNYVGNY